jgi:L-ascorbate metabolism protein UlaG (beta-lactamase superfamily)
MTFPPGGAGFSRPSLVVAAVAAAAVAAFAAVASGLGRTSDRIPASGGDIVITPLIHSSVQIEYGSTVIQIDPWSAGDLSGAKPADLILITDDPVHHLDVTAIERLRKPGAAVIVPAIGKPKVPDGTVLANGAATMSAGVKVEAIPAYDLTPGEPYHAKGKSNGYVISLGNRRLVVAGIGECVPELRALKDIDVAFVPVNLPAGRMAPAAAADCVKALAPRIVYPYHYDQAYAARATNPRASNATDADSAKARAAVDEFVRVLAADKTIEVRVGPWYPPRSN